MPNLHDQLIAVDPAAAPPMNPYSFLSRIPRHTYIALACILYVLLLWLGGNAFAVAELPGRGYFSKVYHVIFYAGMAAMAWLSLKRPSVAKVVLLVMLAGAGDEINQSFHPFRTAAVSDVLLDTLAGMSMALVMQRLRCLAMTRAKF